MQKKTAVVFFVFLLCVFNVCPDELRAFDEIFPNLGRDVRNASFSSAGFYKSSRITSGHNIIGRNAEIDPQITEIVLTKNPGFLVESILVIPPKQNKITILDIYNSLQNVRDLKGRLYYSETKKQTTPLFEDATRLKSEKQTTAIPDPPPASAVPQTETVYVRLKDVNFGNSFYRGDMALVQNGLRYSLTNFRHLTYLLVPVIKEGNFFAQLYIEPIREGVLIYSIAGADISDFFSSKIGMDSAISKRLGVITAWAADGIARIN